MPDVKPKYANYPERELKVVIGSNINAATIKSLTRLTIGTYEMSFLQQENGKRTCDAVKTALHPMVKTQGFTVATEASREFVGVFKAASAAATYSVWVSTPFELTQSGHLLWVKYQELTGENRVGVAYKLATAYSADDVTNLLKTAVKNAVKLAEGEAFTLKGNPAPRFQKKTAAPAAEQPAGEAAEAAAPAEAVEAPAAPQA